MEGRIVNGCFCVIYSIFNSLDLFEKELGRGSFGEVYITTKDGKKYATKIARDEDISTQTEREFADFRKFSCPFLVSYIGYFRFFSAE
jgi:predicted Ser/Thr protein kinase